MTTATTQILITAKDSTAGAFASVNSGLSGLSSIALKAAGALSALGAGALVGSFAAFTKQTIDAQDEMSKLSQKTGIAVESLAGLEFAAEQSGVKLDQVAKATRQFGLIIAEAGEAGSTSARKLEQLGLSYQDLKDLSPEKQLLALADALQKFGKEDRAVALTSVLGNRMADLIPLLSGGADELANLIEQGKKFNPVTTESAKQAERFNDQINVLSKSVSTLGREMVQGIIPSLTRVTDSMIEATQQSGILAGALAGVKQLFTEAFGNPKILGDVGQIRREIFKTKDAISSLELKKDSVFFDKNALLHEKDKLAQLEIDLQKAIGTSQQVIAAQDATTASTKKFAIALEETNKPLARRAAAIDSVTKKVNDQSRIEDQYIKLLKIERQAQTDLLRPYQQSATAASERLQSLQQESQALQLSQTRQISLEQAIELTTIARLEEKRAITKDGGAVVEIDKEIAARKQIIGVIQQTEQKTKGLEQVTQSTTDEVSQLWIQAGRNIQSTLANSIFNFFNDGLKGMLNNVISTVGRIASEFAALKLAQGIGLGSIFGGAGGGGGGASNALSIASLASSGLSFAKGGFGTLGLASSALSGLGSLTGSSSLSAFAGGLGGDAIGGLAAGGFSSSAAGASSLGAGIGAAAGPLIAFAVVDQIGRLFGGDKKLGGAEQIPVIGGFLAGLFGRGPYKFRQQSLQGEASSGGFDGDLTNVFRAKGGLFRSNGHKSVSEQLSLEAQTVLDSTIQGFYKSASGFAQNLGLSADLVDNFTSQVQIKSEKGKQVTEEAIQEMLTGIGNSLARNLLPEVDSLRKAGEDSFATLSRLNSEFVSLSQAALNLGASAEYAKELISGMGIAARTSFLDQYGGSDRLAADSASFSQLFLTEAERMAPVVKVVEDGLISLGYSADLTKEQFKNLVQTLIRSSSESERATGVLLLQNNALFATVADYKEATKQAVQATEELTSAQDDYILSVQGAIRKMQLDSAANQIAIINAEIDKLVDFADSLKSTVDQISPQSLDSARNQIIAATSAARGGTVTDVSSALATIAGQGASGFSDRNSFERSKSQSADLIRQLSEAISSAIGFKQSSVNDDLRLAGRVRSFDVGGVVPSTGLALIHKGERLINPQQNEAIVSLLQRVAEAVQTGAERTDNLYKLMRGMTNNGQSLNTSAA